MPHQQTLIVGVEADLHKCPPTDILVPPDAIIDLITALWLGFVGACIGSFLNVVAYRMPRGMSVIWKPSHCPKCDHPIRPYDNVPVFGWLWLKGKCRDCGEPISPRYAIVEFVMGLAFFILAYAELFSGGANLPGGPITELTGAVNVVWAPQWELLRVYVFHVLLLSLLASIALIDLDRMKTPFSFTLSAAIIGVLLTMLGAQPWVTDLRVAEELRYASRFAFAILGAGSGFLAAATTAALWRGRHAATEEIVQKERFLFERKGRPFGEIENLLAAFTLTGLFLGSLSVWFSFVSCNLLLVVAKGVLPIRRWENCKLAIPFLFLSGVVLVVALEPFLRTWAQDS